MEVADAMVTTEEDAAGVGKVVAGWEDEDNETGRGLCVTTRVGGVSGQWAWCNKRQRQGVNKQMVS